MMYLMYAVFDKKADKCGYGLPMYLPDEETAVAMFRASIASDGSVLAARPDDFALYFVGSYETDDCTFMVGERSLVTTVKEQMQYVFAKSGKKWYEYDLNKELDQLGVTPVLKAVKDVLK